MLAIRDPLLTHRLRDGFVILQEKLETILATYNIKGNVFLHFIGNKQAVLYVDSDTPVITDQMIQIEQELRKNAECDKRLMYLFWRFTEKAVQSDIGSTPVR